MIYLDGSALLRFLPGVHAYAEFAAWVEPHMDEVVTTQLGLTELRQAVELYPRETKDRAFAIADSVRARVAQLRFSDENVTVSTHAASVLQPFAALHLGAAVTNKAVTTLCTYDRDLARVAQVYELAIVSPGMPEGWQNM